MDKLISVCVVLNDENTSHHEVERLLTKIGAKEVCAGLATLSARFDKTGFRKLFDVNPPDNDVGLDLQIPVELKDKVKSMAVMPRPQRSECKTKSN